ncbi:N-acetyl-gamma-glutamyl-phosphate reductase [Rhodoluna sp.]|uniref:N-acetyl-gamma-glutamyl-phosphate reductase n=1 Tax=Rhodoluna sp. TaxID=1969481 RepID=UPI0025CD3424|nr:N-acetyl-gamma-glutamyl-phosphate reductase [Rhodoluna sp.]
MAFSVAIAGASGNVGGELLRLIAEHPQLELKTVTASSMVGQKVSSLHPQVAKYADVVFTENNAENLAGHDIVFLALPHSKSAEVAQWLAADTLVLDCGADFRLESEADWQKFYGGDHAGTWTYGMPELLIGGDKKQRELLRGTKRIAVPGCNVTAITLGLAPALQAGLVETTDIVSVLTVGTSGAGRGATEKLFEVEPTGSANAYQVGGIHRHTPEIEQNLSKSAGAQVQVSFTPVLASIERGILAVNTAVLKPGVDIAQVAKAYKAAYGNEQFINVYPAGEFPSTADTIGANNALIGLAVDEHANRLVSVCAIDNLVKGTGGAAIQSMNIALGLPEQTGLESISLSKNGSS